MDTHAAIYTDNPILSQADAVGQGFNVYGNLDSSSLTRPLVDPAKAGTSTFRFQGVDYTVPDYVIGVENTSSYVVKTVAETREQAQEEIAVHANVGGSYGAFSGEISSDFDYTRDVSSDSYYCYWRSFNQLAVLETNPDKAKRALSDDFSAAVAALPLPLSEDNKTQYFDFFATYGPYYTRAVTLGGDLSIFNEVSKSSELTTTSIELALKAQFDGLYATGSLDLGGLTTAQWQSYRSESNIGIKALGGDQALLNQLAGVDPWSFSEASADLATQWAKSLGSEPALVDFTLGGVWELIDDTQRSAAVQEAWQLFATVMHPHVSIRSSSYTMPWPVEGPADPPILIVGRILKPITPPATPIGLQVTVLQGIDPVDKHAVLFDNYYCLPLQQDWSATYAAMWDQMAQDVFGTYDQPGNILLLSTFGLDRNMPPTDTAAALLDTAGAGDTVATWIQNCDPGSTYGAPGYWTGYPFVYAFAGVFGSEQGTAVETAANVDAKTALSLSLHLYRQAYGGQYTVAQG